MHIWPAIDLRGGKCVRLRQGDFSQETVYGDDPAEMARRWVADGAQRLHLVDLDGARDGQATNRDAIARIVSAVDVPCQAGGGIRDEATIAALMELGVRRLVVGTKAVTDPAWFAEMARCYPGRLAVGIDAREGRVAISGWEQASGASALELARSLSELPLAAVIYTDIARDGMLAGPNVAAMAEMAAAVPLPVVASGGVTTVDDVRSLAETGVQACIIGRALYEGSLSIAEAQAAAGES